MNEVNQTLFIPLYGKSRVSQKGIILKDRSAEEIWREVQFPLSGRAKSSWLTYFMAMRARVFDEWTAARLASVADAVVLHIGCGLDSRVLRTGCAYGRWYDIDFPQVIALRRKYYCETDTYRMVSGDASDAEWLAQIPAGGRAVVILEGVSMYLQEEAISRLFSALDHRYDAVDVLMDAYTAFGAKASKYKNPVRDVGVTAVYGLEDPTAVLNRCGLRLLREHSMTPDALVNELHGLERLFFKAMFAGTMARKVYRLYEYGKE